MCEELREVAFAAEKLGTVGTTLYICENFTSELHQDKDAVRGLCAQFELIADASLKEYAFIYATYGLYVVSQGNALW